MKRIIVKLIILSLTLSSIFTCIQPVSAENITNGNELVKTLGIMVGDESGFFNEDGCLTREQLAKITVAIADSEYIPVNSVSPYKDVPYQAWSSGYIKRVSELGIFVGFPDGTFRPGEYVNIEQACKIMLELLGYGNIGASADWANSQVNAAKGKGILEGVSYVVGQPVTRGNIAILIKNTLLSQKKDSPEYLIKDLGYNYFENVVIISDKNISGGNVSTSVGNFKKTNAIDEDKIGKSGNIVINKKNELVYFEELDNNSKVYIVKSVAGDSITVFNENGGISGIADEMVCYINGQQMPYSQMKALLKIGDKLSVVENRYGNVDYIHVSGQAISEPGFSREFPITMNTIIIKDGVKCSFSSVDSYDICYYISDVDTLLVYSKRVSGVYENAYPTKDNINSVVVSGTEYVVGYKNASVKLSSEGNIRYGDTVTLLFGKDNTVVDVISMNNETTITGYLVNCRISERITEKGNKVFEYISDILTTDGNINSYSVEKDYSDYKGKIVSAGFKSGKATLKIVNEDKLVSGTFNWNQKTLGKYKISENIDIIDVMDVDYENPTGKGIGVFPQRIDNAYLNGADILYAEVEDGEITGLILNDYTGDIYEYGIVLNAENKVSDYIMQGTYELNVSGNVGVYVRQNGIHSVSAGDVIALDAVGMQPVLMKKINSYSGKVTSVDEMYAYIGDAKYMLSDDALIYNQISNTASGAGFRYEIIEKENIDFERTVVAYYDKSENEGGRVRMIVVRK